MQKNFFVASLVLCLASNSWGAHLITSKNCLPCILTANSLKRTQEKSLDNLLAVTRDAEDENLQLTRYIQKMDKVRERTRSDSIRALLKLHDASDNIATIPRQQEKHRHNKRFINCKYATLPVRHTRAAEIRESSKHSKRRAADLTLCHFKICNMMGRKRN